MGQNGDNEEIGQDEERKWGYKEESKIIDFFICWMEVETFSRQFNSNH